MEGEGGLYMNAKCVYVSGNNDGEDRQYTPKKVPRPSTTSSKRLPRTPVVVTLRGKKMFPNVKMSMSLCVLAWGEYIFPPSYTPTIPVIKHMGDQMHINGFSGRLTFPNSHGPVPGLTMRTKSPAFKSRAGRWSASSHDERYACRKSATVQECCGQPRAENRSSITRQLCNSEPMGFQNIPGHSGALSPIESMLLSYPHTCSRLSMACAHAHAHAHA